MGEGSTGSSCWRPAFSGVATTSTAIAAAIREKRKAIELEIGGVRIELLRVEPGSFELGSLLAEEGRHPGEGPIRRVTLTRPFYLGKYPITQSQYTAVTNRLPDRPAGPNVAIDDLRYAETLAFCDDLTRATGVRVTLPFKAQWEYACRAGTSTRFWSGDREEDLVRVGWCRENAEGHAWEVGLKPANPWGFHDIHGNVWECCRDELQDYGTISLTDPVGKIVHWDQAEWEEVIHEREEMIQEMMPTDSFLVGLIGNRWQGVMRGGAWTHPAEDCRSAVRMPADAFAGLGMRIAIAADNPFPD